MTRKSTRNAAGGGSIRKRPDGRWEARYTTGRDPGTGKQIQKSVYGDTQAEVRKKLQQATTAIDEGIYLEPAKMSVGQWLDLWVSEYAVNLRENTKVSYETQIERHIKPYIGAVRLPALTAPAIQAFYNDLRRGKAPLTEAKDSGNYQYERKPLSPKTIKNVHGVLNKAMNQAVSIGYLRFNPCSGIQLPRIEKKPIHPFEDADMKAFLGAIKGQPLEILFKVTLFTGLRQSEAMGLTWGAVDFDKGTILVDRQLVKEKWKNGIYKFTPPKNNKSRLLSPAPSVMRLLKDQRRQQAEWRLKLGEAWENKLDLVFTNELGQHYAHNTLSRSFKRIADSIGLPDSRFHDLRHTYAVNALQSGDDIKTVQESLGHHTAAFTLDVYGHVTERMKKASADRMEAYILELGNL